MNIYTVVYDDYDVVVYRTLKGLIAHLPSETLYFSDTEQETPITASQIRSELRKGNTLRLSTEANYSDWYCRVERQTARD
jgi:hypothetical protein